MLYIETVSFNRKIILVLALLVILLVGLLFYSRGMKLGDSREEWVQREAEMSALEIKLQKIANEIKAAQGEGKCEDSWDCHLVGLGSKTCEGYRNFLLYSSRDADEPTLLAKVREFNEANKKMMDQAFSVPACGAKSKNAVCADNHCVVNK